MNRQAPGGCSGGTEIPTGAPASLVALADSDERAAVIESQPDAMPKIDPKASERAGPMTAVHPPRLADTGSPLDSRVGPAPLIGGLRSAECPQPAPGEVGLTQVGDRRRPQETAA